MKIRRKQTMNVINYQKELDKTIVSLQKEGRVPNFCCTAAVAPCSSYVLEYFVKSILKSRYFIINPNIYPESEYTKRILEQQELISRMNLKHPVSFLAGNYEKDRFYRMAEGLEDVKEGGARCFKCYALRLRETAQMAKKAGYDYFTTTLSISPMKNAAKLNEIGLAAQKEFGVKYLQSDFKKKNGYKRSIELSKEYGLYRQDYCGCEFSQRSSTQ